MEGHGLVVGNAATSPRSLIAWVALTRAGLPFELERIDLHAEGALERVLAVNPGARLPVLRSDGLLLDEPLAIAEYAAELAPELWPQDPRERARARALCADLLYGLQPLAELLPFDVTGRFPRPERLVEVQEQGLARLRALLEPRLEAAADAPFLFGAFGLADVFALPWAVRRRTYDLDLGGAVDAYFARLLDIPEFAVWEAMAAEETGTAPAVRPRHAPAKRPAPPEPVRTPEVAQAATPEARNAAPVRPRRPLFRRRVMLSGESDVPPSPAPEPEPGAAPEPASGAVAGAGDGEPAPAGRRERQPDAGLAVKPIGPEAARRRFRLFGP